MMTANHNPTRIRLADERKAEILRQLTALYADDFDETLSQFRAEKLMKFFIQKLGPAVYNQAIQDARKYMSDRLDDLDATFYEAEPTVKPGSVD